MNKNHLNEKEVDCTNCGRGVWLVKVPKYINERWVESPPNTEVGRLKVTRNQGKMPSVTFSLTENLGKDGDAKRLPKEHKFMLRSKETLLGVFSQTMSNSESAAAENEKIFVEGHVIQKFECQPVVDSNYIRIKKEAYRKATVPARQAVMLDAPVQVYKPISIHTRMKELEEKKKNEGKKARDDWEKVQEMLFAAFEKHQYYNIKDLQKITNQPITYLKEILKEMCDYNVKNPHKNMWELKREYRHYKHDDEKKEARKDGAMEDSD